MAGRSVLPGSLVRIRFFASTAPAPHFPLTHAFVAGLVPSTPSPTWIRIRVALYRAHRTVYSPSTHSPLLPSHPPISPSAHGIIMRARPLALSRIARTLPCLFFVFPSPPLFRHVALTLRSSRSVYVRYTYRHPINSPAASVAPLQPATLVLPLPSLRLSTRPADIPAGVLPRRAGSVPRPRSVADQELAGPALAFIGQPAAHAISCFLMPWPRSQGARVCSDYQTQPRPRRRAGVNHSMHAHLHLRTHARRWAR